jgi:hypothetical protein
VRLRRRGIDAEKTIERGVRERSQVGGASTREHQTGVDRSMRASRDEHRRIVGGGREQRGEIAAVAPFTRKNVRSAPNAAAASACAAHERGGRAVEVVEAAHLADVDLVQPVAEQLARPRLGAPEPPLWPGMWKE